MTDQKDTPRISREQLVKIINHPLFSESDFNYFTSKGYTPSEILGFWDRDWKQGHRLPLVHKSAPDLVGYLNE